MYLKDYPFYAYVSYSCLLAGTCKKVQKNSMRHFNSFASHISTFLHSRIIIRDSRHLVLHMLKVLNTHTKLTGDFQAVQFLQLLNFYTHGKKNKRTEENNWKKNTFWNCVSSLFFAQKSDVTCCCDILSCFYLK